MGRQFYIEPVWVAGFQLINVHLHNLVHIPAERMTNHGNVPENVTNLLLGMVNIKGLLMENPLFNYVVKFSNFTG